MSKPASNTKPLSPIARRSLGEFTKEQYRDLILGELVNQGFFNNKTTITKNYIKNTLVDQKVTPELSGGDTSSSQSVGEIDKTKSPSRRTRLGIKVKSNDEIAQHLDTEKFNHKDQTIEELTQLFYEKAEDARNFIAGMKEYLVVDEARRAIKEYDQMIDEIRIKVMLKDGDEYKNGYTTHIRAHIQTIGHEITQLEKLIADKLHYQEPSVVENYYRRKDIAHRTRADQFVIFDDREKKIHTAIEHLVMGEHVLLEGPTGSGKTIIAQEISKRIKNKLGPSSYSGDGATLSKLTQPEQFDAIVQKCIPYQFSGHSRTNAQDFTVKLGLTGETEIIEQVVGMLRAIHEGVPFIIDEIDLIPNEVLMSIKALFTLKPGSRTIPDSGTGTIAYQIPRKPMLIATMNGANDKHKRNKLDPAMLRLFGYQDRLGYINTEQTYDYLLAQLFNEHDYIDGATYNEIADKATGVLPALLNFIDMVNQSYQGKKPITLPTPILGVTSIQKGLLKDKVIEMGKLNSILAKRKGDKQGKSLTDYITDEILILCLGHADPEDTALLLRAAIVSGLISKTDETQARIIADRHGRTQDTTQKLFESHDQPSPIKRNESQTLLINAWEIGMTDYVVDETQANTQKTRNKPSLKLGKHKKIIDMLNEISKNLNGFVHVSLSQILELNKPLEGRENLLKQPDNLMKNFTQVIDTKTITNFIDQVNQMIIQTDLTSMTDQGKKEQLTKEKDLLTLLGAIPGGEEYIKDILDGERYKVLVVPHVGSYAPSEYPSDGPWMSTINGIRTNFVDGTKWKQADGTYTVEKTRNEQIKQIGDKLIAEKKFQIHSVTYDGYQIPVFSLWDEATKQRVSISTTQHMIPVDRAEQWNKKNPTKKQMKKYDFRSRTPGQNTSYNVSTMAYDDSNLGKRSEKRTRNDNTDGLPYGDHLTKMADGGCDGGVSITIEHEPAGYFEGTFIPLLSKLSGYENVTTLDTMTDIHTLLWYLIGTCGLLYYNDVLSFCYLGGVGCGLGSYDRGGNDYSALCTKITWPPPKAGNSPHRSPKASGKNIPGQILDKPTNVTDYEVSRTNKVTKLPEAISLQPAAINGVNFPAFSDSLVDHKTRNPGVDDDQIKQSYEGVVKQQIANRANEWIKQHVSYVPNYKGCCDIGIVIHHPKLNKGDGMVVYPINKPDYVKDIQTKNKISDQQAKSSIKKYADYITGKQGVAFLKRTFSDKDNIVLDVAKPGTLIETVTGANNPTDPNLLKLVLEDIVQQDKDCGSIFQGFTDREQLISAITSDCGFDTDSNDKLSLILTQYIINAGYWYRVKSQVNGRRKIASCFYLGGDDRMLGLGARDEDGGSALCTDYLAPASVSLSGSPDTDSTRKSNREQLSKNLTGDDLKQSATDRNGNGVPNKTNLEYIIDQCDEFMSKGGVTFDYTHNGIPGCTKFNISTAGNNVFRPLLPTDLPQATTVGDHFTKLYDAGFLKPQINVYLRAMMDENGKVTDDIDTRIDTDITGNPNYFKTLAQTYQQQGLTLNDKKKYNIFLYNLAQTLNIKEESGEDKKFAMVAYQYIMATMIGRYRGSMRDTSFRFNLKLWEDGRRWDWSVDSDESVGVVFAGSA